MSSSLRYTLTKLRSLPSSLKICLRRSGYSVISAASTSPTVAPGTVTESCFAVNCRSGVGISTLGMSVDQLLFWRFGLIEVGQKAIGVVELAFLNRQDDEGVPRAGIPQIGGGKIRVAIGMRVIDADEVHVAFPCGLIGGQQVLWTEFVAGGLRALESVFQRDGLAHGFCVAVCRPQHGAAALVGIAGTRVGHHGGPGFGFDANHSWSQNFSLRYFSALSQRMVTMVALSSRAAISRARRVAAYTLQPDEIPTSRPSSLARRRTMRRSEERRVGEEGR